jgi:hypothetical protein
VSSNNIGCVVAEACNHNFVRGCSVCLWWEKQKRLIDLR